MSVRAAILTILLCLAGSRLFSAEEPLQPLHGNCTIAPSTMPERVRYEFRQGDCGSDHQRGDGNCYDHDSNDVPISEFAGLALADFEREGAHLEARIVAEAGTITCSGAVHDLILTGELTFVPDATFVERMARLGFSGLDSSKLEAYTLFHIETSWVQGLQAAGVSDMNAGNIIALRIFKVTPDFVHEMASLGYPNLGTEKLTAFRIHGVNADEVKRVRALGYNPTADELIQMRIFKVTPDFIERMRNRGFDHLTISKLVQIRIFNLAD